MRCIPISIGYTNASFFVTSSTNSFHLTLCPIYIYIYIYMNCDEQKVGLMSLEFRPFSLEFQFAVISIQIVSPLSHFRSCSLEFRTFSLEFVTFRLNFDPFRLNFDPFRLNFKPFLLLCSLGRVKGSTCRCQSCLVHASLSTFVEYSRIEYSMEKRRVE